MDLSTPDAFPPIQEVLLEFRAGKMLMNGIRVIPDSRKGLVRIGKVNQTSGRVYILKFHTDDRKFFFWMQEPKIDSDTELCNSVNFYLNQSLELLGEEEPDVSVPDVAEDDIVSRDGNMVGWSMGAESTGDVTSSGPVKLSDLQRILSDLGSAAVAEDPDAGLGLGDILKPEFLWPLIQELPLHQQLAPYLPLGVGTPEDLVELLQCPSFRQQLDSFSFLLRSGDLNLRSFGVDPTNFKFTVPSFLEALEDSVSSTSEPSESSQGGTNIKTQTFQESDSMDEGQ